ncbi:MAG: ABC transporter substrate-binding protein [Neisseriaceae bacterium]|nr:ABC transporter substrate-binding protein [Neisseriaceae bacterium]
MAASTSLISRRQLLLGLLASGVLLAAPGFERSKTAERTVVDIAGRTVSLTRPIKRILLGDGTLAYAMALLCPEDPFGAVVGWGSNFRAADYDGYEAYRRRFPQLADIVRFPSTSRDAIGNELALSLEPDVVVMNLSSRGAVEASGLMALLAKLGVALVFVDFSTQIFHHSARSIEILGTLFGRSERAKAFLRFRAEQLARVFQPLKGIQHRPTVMLERAAGLYEDCCLSYGEGNFGALVTAAGGDHLGSRFIQGTFGTLHPEQVIASEPDVVLVTGANWSLYAPTGDWVNLGPGADPIEGQARLQRLMQRPAYRTLQAVQNGRVHAIWHPFYDNPYHFVALQQLAKWLHPERFQDLDPEATFIELHQRFLPIPYQPGYWLSLNGASV